MEHEAAFRRVAKVLIGEARGAVDAMIEVEDRIAAIDGSAERMAATWNGISTSRKTSTFVPMLDQWIEYVQKALGFSAEE